VHAWRSIRAGCRIEGSTTCDLVASLAQGSPGYAGFLEGPDARGANVVAAFLANFVTCTCTSCAEPMVQAQTSPAVQSLARELEAHLLVQGGWPDDHVRLRD